MYLLYILVSRKARHLFSMLILNSLLIYLLYMLGISLKYLFLYILFIIYVLTDYINHTIRINILLY